MELDEDYEDYMQYLECDELTWSCMACYYRRGCDRVYKHGNAKYYYCLSPNGKAMHVNDTIRMHIHELTRGYGFDIGMVVEIEGLGERYIVSDDPARLEAVAMGWIVPDLFRKLT